MVSRSPTNFVTLMKVIASHQPDRTRSFGMILLYAATQIPFSVFLIYAFVDSLPRELDEAAFIDGCSASPHLLRGRPSRSCDRCS